MPEIQKFNTRQFLETPGIAKTIVKFKKKDVLFRQQEVCKAVMYIMHGVVKLTVMNEAGKEAVIALLGRGDFVGEAGLAGQNVRLATATAASASTIMVIELKEMLRVLHCEHALSDLFINYALRRTLRVEEDLMDQLFNHAEKRLARVLLLLASYGKADRPEFIIPNVSQTTLAEMVGTTRGQVTMFMNKFREKGYIRYNGGIHVNDSLLRVMSYD